MCSRIWQKSVRDFIPALLHSVVAATSPWLDSRISPRRARQNCGASRIAHVGSCRNSCYPDLTLQRFAPSVSTLGESGIHPTLNFQGRRSTFKFEFSVAGRSPFRQSGRCLTLAAALCRTARSATDARNGGRATVVSGSEAYVGTRTLQCAQED